MNKSFNPKTKDLILDYKPMGEMNVGRLPDPVTKE